MAPAAAAAAAAGLRPPALPLADWPLGERRQVVGVLTDIDDTLTEHGQIAPAALAALADLRDAGLPVLAITGRPSGWSEPFALAWPLSAIVAENGAVGLWRGADGGLQKAYLQAEDQRRRNFERLQAVTQQVLLRVPGARLAEDSAGRETDIAIDHSEFHHLSATQIAEVLACMRQGGLSASVSSIHINGWIGEHDKWVGAQWMLRRHLGRSLAAERGRWVYVGDSTNDARMFAQLPNSVGVANVARFWAELVHRPRYVSRAARGQGFAEVAAALLAAR